MPGFKVELSITGLQEAQQKNLQDMNALKPDGALGEAIKWGMIAGHAFAVKITHVDTGAWKASHRMEYRTAGGSPRGEVYIDPGARNPRHPTPVAEYATIWELREGDMAVYLRTEKEQGDKITKGMQKILYDGMAD